MKYYFKSSKNLYLLLFAITIFTINIVNIVFNTPMIADQHWAQKIFYVHVPSAWVGFLSYFIVMIAGLMLLIKKNDAWDDVVVSAAELGTFFMGLVLITGPIWARPIWGTFWIWEPRLTTTLILFLYYTGFFMFRSFGGNIERVRRQSAILGILAFVNSAKIDEPDLVIANSTFEKYSSSLLLKLNISNSILFCS